MAERLAIFHPAGRLGLKANPFGKDVANLQLFQALAWHGGFSRVDVLSQAPNTDAQLREDLQRDGVSPTATLGAGTILAQQTAAAAGALLRGQPDLYDLAWLRRRTVGDRAHSLLGVIHTIAPPAMRQIIAMSLMGPTHPWDAVVCTSPSVQQAMGQMLGEVGDYLAERTGGRRPQGPQLPIIPLGVHAESFAALADRPDVRDALRQRLGVADGEILVLWVGRLSFFEKAFPQPMFEAVQQAATQAGVKAHFALAGWFPGENDQAMYAEAAAAHAPEVRLHVLDGNDRTLLGELWAGADIFLSLVDNVQETFGITPLEAMAAGLPVVASDWDGYRYTMVDGETAFLIPTLIGPAGGLGQTMAARHVMGLDSYQSYAGNLAQHTAVHLGRAAQALAQLMADADLRRRMGAAGRARARALFDWPVVARQYNGLVDELARIRAGSADPEPRSRRDPARGDPFRDFAGFATSVLGLETRLVARGDPAVLLELDATVRLDHAFSGSRGTIDECADALRFLGQAGGASVQDVLLQFPQGRRRLIEMGLLWMAKLGFVDWMT
jgi:D-inositol-3-phosphate glycosyltransferase